MVDHSRNTVVFWMELTLAKILLIIRSETRRSDQIKPAKIEHDKSVARITLIVAQPAMPGQCSFAFALLLVDDTPFFIKTLYLT